MVQKLPNFLRTFLKDENESRKGTSEITCRIITSKELTGKKSYNNALASQFVINIHDK